MRKAYVALLVLALTACSGMPPPSYASDSPCSGGRESTYACQVERYSRVGGP